MKIIQDVFPRLSYHINKQVKLRGNTNNKFHNYARSAPAAEIMIVLSRNTPLVQ